MFFKYRGTQKLTKKAEGRRQKAEGRREEFRSGIVTPTE
jgi:hypothetical protein